MGRSYCATIIYDAATGTVSITDTGVTYITIEWANFTGNIASYNVSYKLINASSQEVYTVTNGERMFTAEGLQIRADYSFKVSAVNEDSVGECSSTAVGTTATPTGTCTLHN